MKQVLVLISVMLGSSFLASKNPLAHRSANGAPFKRHNAGKGPEGTISIIVDKSDYSLLVYDDKGWYATYPVVFGNNSLEDKRYAGDKNTPEGTFRITGKRIHEKWYRFLAIDYPTKESWAKFNRRKENGEIPQNASIGGSIGIHGTWPNEDFVIDEYKNWTLGCISMKRSDVEDFYNYTPVGTKITIRK